MITTGNTVLITGGSTGIGLALAASFTSAGNEVIICGRNEEKLQRAKEKLPKVNTRKCDITSKGDVESLFSWITSSFPDINILVNNAGIQRAIDLRKGIDGPTVVDDEIAINLRAQIYLSTIFIPVFLSRQGSSAIVNVSSGLALVPLARFPIYCATKAGIHSFTKSLRFQLRDSGIKVFEVLPPTVYDTELKGSPLPKNDWTVSSDEVAGSVLRGLEKDEYEISIGSAKNWARESSSELDQAFNYINNAAESQK